MDQSANGGSANVMELNSPKVLEKKSSPFDEDSVGPLVTNSKFTETSLNSALSKEKHKSESRRVSFPEDDKIISGYGEPRNPWAQAKTTSTEELIQSYTQSCQQWGVKPITKLLLQLQEIHDFSVRANSLTLKGEKLDTKVVETLESVFKRVQFVLVDVEATNLDEDAAAALFDMIEYYESAVNVLVGFNKNLGTRGWQAAGHMMRKMSCLRLFDGHSVPLTEQAVPFVGRALRLSNTLVTLHLESASLSGRPILLIVAALRMNVTLKELFLADNHLTSTDALQIANLLKFNSVLNLLDLRNNLIQDAGLCHLCVGLAGQPNSNSGGGLQTLVLWNNQISHQSMAKLSAALKMSTSLCTLNLGQNVLGDDGASKLKDGLLKNRSLLRLGMVGTKLTCEGAIALAEYLAESSRIIRLDLRNNEIKFGGLMALSLAFKINFSLLRLDIDRPTSKDTLKELVEKQELMFNNIQEYSTRNKEQAVLRVNSQQEKKKQSGGEETDNTAPGLRYMDMTSSAVLNGGVITSQNNSNNKSPSTQVMVHSSQVDDSPINSPEFLPANSVSYHQVSPVMFSSSEMQKRAALAKLDAELNDKKETSDLGVGDNLALENDSQLKFDTHETTSDTQASTSVIQETTSDTQASTSVLQETTSDTQASAYDSQKSTLDTQEPVSDTKESAFDLQESASDTQDSVSNLQGTELDTRSCGDVIIHDSAEEADEQIVSTSRSCGDLSDNNTQENTETSSKDAFQNTNSCVKPVESSRVLNSDKEIKDDSSIEKDSELGVSSETDLNSNSSFNSSNTESVSHSENLSLQPENSFESSVMDTPESKLETHEQDSGVDNERNNPSTSQSTQESNVTVTHFDLSLFPKD